MHYSFKGTELYTMSFCGIEVTGRLNWFKIDIAQLIASYGAILRKILDMKFSSHIRHFSHGVL